MKLRNWVIEQIKTKDPEDVDLLIAHDSHEVGKDEHGTSFDYFVPANERGMELARTFIIDGVGHDLYPRPWERLEGMAECNDDGIFTLYRGKIVYARNDEVRERYLALQQRMNDHLKDRQFCYRKALEQLDMAMNLYSTLMFEDMLTRARLSGGYIIDCLNKAIGFLNGTVAVVYCEEITSLSDLSQNYNVYRKALYTASNVQEIKNLSHLLRIS